MTEPEDIDLGEGERVSKGRQRSSYGGSPPDEPNAHPGAVMAGFVITILIGFSVYSGMWMFMLYLTMLLVVLALGSKALN